MDQGSKQNPATEILKCPLCSGRGELCMSELLERLREKDFSRKVEAYLANVVEPELKSEPREGPTFEQNVRTWNCTHFLWRRSPKE